MTIPVILRPIVVGTGSAGASSWLRLTLDRRCRHVSWGDLPLESILGTAFTHSSLHHWRRIK